MNPIGIAPSADSPFVFRGLDPSRIEDNYLLKEMSYRIAPGTTPLSCAPLLSCLGSALLPAWLLRASVASAALISGATEAATPGNFIERWLSFAQATNTVALYH